MLWFMNTKLGRWLVAGFTVMAAVGLALWRAFAAGKKSERAAQVEQRLDTMKRAKDVEEEIAAAGSADVDARLSRWMRDDKR